MPAQSPGQDVHVSPASQTPFSALAIGVLAERAGTCIDLALLFAAGLPTTLIDAYNAQDILNLQKSPGGFRWTVVVTLDQRKAFDWIQSETSAAFLKKNVAVMHCIAAYPAPPEEANPDTDEGEDDTEEVAAANRNYHQIYETKLRPRTPDPRVDTVTLTAVDVVTALRLS